jgi:hypothetical protein
MAVQAAPPDSLHAHQLRHFQIRVDEINWKHLPEGFGESVPV